VRVDNRLFPLFPPTLFFFSCVASALWAGQYTAPDIVIPIVTRYTIGGGEIVISGARFIEPVIAGVFAPKLSFVLVNKTNGPLKSIKLRFEVGGFCNGQPTQWSDELSTSADPEASRTVSDTIIPLVGEVDHCETVLIRATLLSADNFVVSQASEPDTLPVALRAIKAANDVALAEEEKRSRRIPRKRSRETLRSKG
jgi:hypothetical protein